MFRDGLTLQKHVEKNAFPGMLMQILDPVLLSIEEAMASSLQDGRSSTGHVSDAIFSIMKIALSCCKHSRLIGFVVVIYFSPGVVLVL
jgi:hypothetical protein